MARKKKILIINDIATGGGVENVMQNLVKYLSKKNYKITVLTRYYDEKFKLIYPSGVRYWHLLDKQYEVLKRPYGTINKILHKVLLYELQKLRFDVVIAIKEGYMTQWGAMCNASRKLSWVHVDYNYAYWTKEVFITSEAEIKCMKQYDKVVCVSESAKNSVMSTIGNPGNLCVRYNPLDGEEIREKAKESPEYIRNQDKMLFVSVGRLTSQKHFDLLLECVRKIDMKDRFEVWIIGEGDDRLMLENMIRRYNLDHVKLLGSQKNPYPLMKQADWIVSSAVWESFGLVLQEARILGVPVLTTNCPAVEEVFDSDSGIIVKNCEEALKEKLMELISNNDKGDIYREKLKLLDVSQFYERRLEDIEKLWLS